MPFPCALYIVSPPLKEMSNYRRQLTWWTPLQLLLSHYFRPISHTQTLIHSRSIWIVADEMKQSEWINDENDWQFIVVVVVVVCTLLFAYAVGCWREIDTFFRQVVWYELWWKYMWRCNILCILWNHLCHSCAIIACYVGAIHGHWELYRLCLDLEAMCSHLITYTCNLWVSSGLEISRVINQQACHCHVINYYYRNDVWRNQPILGWGSRASSATSHICRQKRPSPLLNSIHFCLLLIRCIHNCSALCLCIAILTW